MKSTLAILGICTALLGTIAGVVNWALTEFILDTVDWEGPLVVVNILSWLINIVGMGTGVVLVGISCLCRSPYPAVDDWDT